MNRPFRMRSHRVDRLPGPAARAAPTSHEKIEVAAGRWPNRQGVVEQNRIAKAVFMSFPPNVSVKRAIPLRGSADRSDQVHESRSSAMDRSIASAERFSS
jgi:hypothetical protein